MGEGTVLVRRRALGDVVLLGAVVAAAEPPVTVVTDARYVPLMARMNGVHAALAWGEGRPSGRVVDLQRSLRSLWQFPSARRVRKHSVARRLRLLGIGSGRPSVTALYAAAVGVSEVPPPWFETHARRDTLVLLPGASTPLKMADPETLARAGRRWVGPVVVLGGPGERASVDRVADAVPGARTVVEHGFDRTLEVLARCRVAMGGDTGLSHLAVAAGAHAVVLAGPTHPDDGFLTGADLTVVGRTLPCRPCGLHRVERCRVGDRRCLDLDDDAVWAAVEAACAGSS